MFQVVWRPFTRLFLIPPILEEAGDQTKNEPPFWWLKMGKVNGMITLNLHCSSLSRAAVCEAVSSEHVALLQDQFIDASKLQMVSTKFLK